MGTSVAEVARGSAEAVSNAERDFLERFGFGVRPLVAALAVSCACAVSLGLQIVGLCSCAAVPPWQLAPAVMFPLLLLALQVVVAHSDAVDADEMRRERCVLIAEIERLEAALEWERAECVAGVEQATASEAEPASPTPAAAQTGSPKSVAAPSASSDAELADEAASSSVGGGDLCVAPSLRQAADSNSTTPDALPPLPASPLAAALSAFAAMQCTPHVPPSPLAALAGGTPIRMLIVEDVTSTRIALRRSLTQRLPRATIDEASSGRAALSLVKVAMGLGAGAKYNVLLVDKEMPQLDGRDLCDAVRAAEAEAEAAFEDEAEAQRDRAASLAPRDSLASPPGGSSPLREPLAPIKAFHAVSEKPALIVGLTGPSLREDQEPFVEHGVDALMTKPVDTEHLLRLCASWVREGKIERAPATSRHPADDTASTLFSPPPFMPRHSRAEKLR